MNEYIPRTLNFRLKFIEDSRVIGHYQLTFQLVEILNNSKFEFLQEFK